jgi:hypothetical protein
MLLSSDILLVPLLAASLVPAAPASSTAPALARLSFAEQRVELSSAGAWTQAKEGAAVRLGDRLRTAADALARLELPWMEMTVGPASDVSFPDGYLLSAVLEQGRVQLRADERGILKLVTGEAEVRGQGRAVVRRQGRTTTVSSLDGRFLVTGAGITVALAAGKGTIVDTGRPPLAPRTLPEPPDALSPGSDPRFVAPGTPVSLTWTPSAARFQIEVLPVGSDDVLIQRDVGAPPWPLVIPWRGAFRWRVAARDESGIEGMPSAEGLLCVDE